MSLSSADHFPSSASSVTSCQTVVSTRWQNVLESVGVASLIIHPFAGWFGALVLLAVHGSKLLQTWRTWWPLRRGYILLWGGVFGLIAARHFVAETWTALWLTLLQGLLVIAASIVLQGKRQTVAWGICLAFLVMIPLAVGERMLLARSWQVSDEQLEFDSSLALGIDSIRDPRTHRLWQLPDSAQSLTMSFDARHLEGPRAWLWQGFPRTIPMTYHDSIRPSGGFSRITFTDEGDTYATRRFEHEHVPGTRYRVSVQLRSVQPFAEGDDNIGRVYLFADRNVSRWARAPLGPAWRTISFEWQPDVEITSGQMSIILNDFNGLIVDVRRASLERLEGERWVSLGVAEGTGASLELTRLREDPVATTHFMPQAAWQSYSLTSPVPELAGEQLYSILKLEPGLAIQTRNVRVITDAGPARPFPHTRRQALWFVQPNLLGHTLAMATVLLALTGSLPWTLVLGLGLGFVGIWLTGSRAAYIAAITAVSCAAWLRLPKARRWWLAVAAVVIVVMALSFQEQLGRLQLFGVDVRTSRSLIWRTAARGFMQAPVLGLGDNTPADYAAEIPAGGFMAFWEATHPRAQELVSHAHNLWLSLASRYGLFGVAAALWLTVCLPWLCWRFGRWRGLSLLVALLLLNAVDETLFHTSTLLLLALGLNTLQLEGWGAMRQS